MLNALTIVITLMVVAGMVGANTGGCFNPTIGLTESTMMLLVDPTTES
jgi:hypothetical protein